MPQMILYTDEIEDKIVNKYSEKWKKSKAETVKRIIRRYGDVEDKFREVKKKAGGN